MSSQNAGGLCPRCLMAMNLDSQTMPQGEKATPMPPLSPEELAEHFPQFEILECLGRGGMGVVYKARQKALERTVALKLLAGEWQGDSGFAERFEKEAKTLAQLSHPNIVTIHDFGEAGGHYFIVMEFVDGVNLRDLLRDGKMEPEQALAIVPPICEALEFAHEKGVVHRDIKPENLLLDRDGRVKIADFGIASLVGTQGEKAGTPAYMAPEQSGTHVDERADIYALGVVLYEMLTGEQPAEDLVSPSRKVEVDVRIDEMVLRALESEPEKRYQTAGEFRTVVERIAKRGKSVTPAVTENVKTGIPGWVPALIAYTVTNTLWVKMGLAGVTGEVGLKDGLSYWFMGSWVVSCVLWALLHYQCWKTLPTRHRAISPGKAVGYLFIPFFNFYWAFVSFPKLADGVNAWRAESGRSPERRLKILGVLYAINFLLYWTVGWDTDWTVTSNAVAGFFVCLFDFITFLLFYGFVVRRLEGEQGSLEAPIKRRVRFAALMALLCGALSVLIPILLFWLKSWTASWLTTQAWGALLVGSAIAGVLAVLLTLFAKRNRRLVVGSINLGICLSLPFLSFLIWMCILVLNLVPKSTGGGGISMVGGGGDSYGRVYEARGGSRSMMDVDGDATIFHIDSDVLRFEKETLQLNGYKVARLPSGIGKIVIEKKGSNLKIFADSKALLSWSKSADGETRLEVLDEYSLVGQSPFGAEVKALLGEFEEDVDLPKLIDIDGAAVRLYRFSKESFSSEETFFDFFSEKGVDFFVEKLGKQWGIVFPKETPIELARIPAVDWRQVEPSQVPDYLSNSDFALEGHENGPFMGLYLPFSKKDSVYLAFRTFAGTEGVMEVTESSEVEGLQFRLRYSPVEESSAEDQGGEFGTLLGELVEENRSQPVTPAQKTVEDRLLAVIGTGMEEMIEQQLMLHGGSEEAVRELRNQFEGEVRKNFALDWGRIQSAFLPTEEEAAHLLKDGPNREKNSEAIKANWKKLEQSNVTIPFIGPTCIRSFRRKQDPWFLESVKRR